MLRILAALACASLLHAADTEDRVRKSVPASSATRLTLNAEFGAIRVQPGNEKTVEVEVRFRGDPPSRAEFDRMLRDFRLDLTQEGTDIRVSGTFRNGWEPQSLSGLFGSLIGGGHPICRNGPGVFGLAAGGGVSHHRAAKVQRRRFDLRRADFRE